MIMTLKESCRTTWPLILTDKYTIISESNSDMPPRAVFILNEEFKIDDDDNNDDDDDESFLSIDEEYNLIVRRTHYLHQIILSYNYHINMLTKSIKHVLIINIL